MNTITSNLGYNLLIKNGAGVQAEGNIFEQNADNAFQVADHGSVQATKAKLQGLGEVTVTTYQKADGTHVLQVFTEDEQGNGVALTGENGISSTEALQDLDSSEILALLQSQGRVGGTPGSTAPVDSNAPVEGPQSVGPTAAFPGPGLRPGQPPIVSRILQQIAANPEIPPEELFGQLLEFYGTGEALTEAQQTRTQAEAALKPQIQANLQAALQQELSANGLTYEGLDQAQQQEIQANLELGLQQALKETTTGYYLDIEVAETMQDLISSGAPPKEIADYLGTLGIAATEADIAAALGVSVQAA